MPAFSQRRRGLMPVLSLRERGRSESESFAPIWKKTPARACTTKAAAGPTAAST